MLKAKAMKKLTIFGPKSQMKTVIDELYELNAVHIEEHTKTDDNEMFDIGEPLRENEEFSEMLVKIRSLISHLNIEKKKVEPRKTEIGAIKQTLDKLHSEVSELLKNKQYHEKIQELYKKNMVQKSLFGLKIGGIDENLKYFIGFVNSDEDLEESIKKITENYVLEKSTFEGLKLIGLFVKDNKTTKIKTLLEAYDFSPIDNPVIKDYYGFNIKPAQKFTGMGNEAKLAEKQAKNLEAELHKHGEQQSDFLLESEEKLKREVEKAEAPLKFGTSKSTFLIKGWVPKKNAAKLKKVLDEKTNNTVMIKLEKPSKKDDVPIEFNHPGIVRPFESFMELYTLPSYKEIDPTFFMFLTFPIFFGFMLGDVGYGLITLSLFLFLKKKMPGAKNMLNAFVIASIATIFFGLIFGEYFGVETLPPDIAHSLGIHGHELHGEIVYPIPHLFARSHQISDLLSLSVLIGIVHILIGLIIGFINILKDHGLKEAMLEKGGWIMIMPMMVWALINVLGIVTGDIATMLSYIVPADSIGMLGALFGVGAILTIIGEGIIGVIEVLFLTLLSNILSYARLMAVGLASLSLAAVVNDMAGQMIAGMGLIGLIPAALILVLGHTINIALGILSPFLHALRLHYVEFFGKFYSGGGRKFNSFGSPKN